LSFGEVIGSIIVSLTTLFEASLRPFVTTTEDSSGNIVNVAVSASGETLVQHLTAIILELAIEMDALLHTVYNASVT
jgi:hypothetical protein